MKKTVLKVLTAMIISANILAIPVQAATMNNESKREPVVDTVTVTQDTRIILFSTEDPRGW